MLSHLPPFKQGDESHGRTLLNKRRNELGTIHTSELDRSEIGLSPKRSECERSNAEIDPRSI